MKGKGCLTSLGGLILVGVAIWGGWHLYAYVRYAPKVNPHPKYFMTIKGHIDPKLGKQLKIIWTASYNTTNPNCNVSGMSGIVEGASAPRSKNTFLKPKIDKNGRYILKIPTDGYTPGFCKWKIYELSYSFSYQGRLRQGDLYTSVTFNNVGIAWKNPVIQDWYCNRTRCNLSKKSNVYAFAKLSRNKNYVAQLNFLQKEE